MPLEEGAVVGGAYRLLRVLGRGGSGTTWEAETLADGTHVAVKQIALATALEWKSIELFEREARVLAELRHPRIPRYLGIVRTDEALFLVQELARGRSLAQRLAEGQRFDEAAARRVAEQVLDALCYLQSTSPPVVHRDIKPSNLVQDDDGILRLVDFGSVRDVAVDSVVGGSTVAGTYGYMAPEQLHGQATNATDLYGLGATLVHLLTRTPPSQLPQRKLRMDYRSRANVTFVFGAFLDRLTAPAPEDRYVSAREALDALRGKFVPEKGVRKRVAILSGVFLALVAGGSLWILRDRARDREHDAQVVRVVRPLPPRPAPQPAMGMKNLGWARVHDYAVFSIALSPDEKTLAVGSFDHGLRTVTVPELTVIRSYVGSTMTIGGTAFLAGDLLLGGGDRVRFWNQTTGALQREVQSGPRVTSVVVLADQKRYVTASFDGQARLFALDGQAPLRAFAHGGGKLLDAVPSPDGRLLATVGDDAHLRIWDLETGARRCDLVGHVGPVDHVVFAPDGTRVATTGDDGSLRTWDPTTCKPNHVRWISDDELWGLDWSADGRFISVGSKDGRLAVIEAITFHVVSEAHHGPQNGLLRLLSDKASARLFVGLGNGGVGVYRLPGQAVEKLPVAHPTEAPIPAGESEHASLVRRARESLDRWSGDRGRLDAAKELLAKADALDARSAPAKVEWARHVRFSGYRSRGDFTKGTLEKAEKLLDAAAAIDPKLVGVDVQRGYLALARDDKATARALSIRLREAHPDDLAVTSLAIAVAREQEDWDLVTKLSPQVLEHGTPRMVAATYNVLAWMYGQRHDYDLASAAYEAELALAPHDVWAKGNYASFLLQRGKTEEALTYIDKALRQASYPMGHQIRADILCHLGTSLLWGLRSIGDAKASFEKARDAAPSPHACATYGLAAVEWLAATKSGDPSGLDAAEKLLRRTLEINPQHENAKAALDQLPKVRTSMTK
ncbi:MAG: protein kinase [Myxococcales bacterium]|nr:protein kinase [Myxococcales bacterium]